MPCGLSMDRSFSQNYSDVDVDIDIENYICSVVVCNFHLFCEMAGRTDFKPHSLDLPIFTADRFLGHEIFCTGEYFLRSASLRSAGREEKNEID